MLCRLGAQLRLGVVKGACSLTGALIVFAAPGYTQVPLTSVPDALSCPRCEITIRTKLTLGTSEGAGALSGIPFTVSQDGLGRFWVFAGAYLPLVFGPDGTFLAEFGRKGEGPGEFQNVADGFPIPGDSMALIDPRLNRVTIVGPDLKVGRLVRVPLAFSPALVLSWPNGVVGDGALLTPAAAGWPLHRLSFAGPDGSVLKSFGPDAGELRPAAAPLAHQRLGTSGGGGFWSADRYRYRVSRWREDGTLVYQLERRPEWFAGPASASLGSPRTPPSPRVGGIWEGQGNLVWTYVHVPAPDWQMAWARVPSEAREYPGRLIDTDKLFHTVIEVIDTGRGHVVVRQSLNRWVIAALAGRQLAVCYVDGNGVPRVDILEVGLKDER